MSDFDRYTAPLANPNPNLAGFVQLVGSASITGDVISNYNWTVILGTRAVAPFSANLTRNSATLIIPANSMTCENSYTFTLYATAKSGAISFATLTIEPICPPFYNGNALVALSPLDGVQLTTNFAIQTAFDHWDGAQPFTYTYSYYTTSDPSEFSMKFL